MKDQVILLLLLLDYSEGPVRRSTLGERELLSHVMREPV